MDLKDGVKMNWNGLMLVVLGLFDLIYFVMARNKDTLRNKNNKLIIINKEKFLKLQQYFTIINSIYLLIFGLIITLFSLADLYIGVVIILFLCDRYLLKIISIKKGYISFR